MSPLLRRIVYVTAFEGFAIVFSVVLLMALGHEETESGITAIVSSVIAVGWNFAFTSAFERWEARNPKKGRSVLRRIIHSLLFETGLVVILTPVLAVLLSVSVIEAFLVNVGLLAYFLVYTYLFNLSFDKLFGLPQSAR